MTSTDDRWLVTINGQVPTDIDMRSLWQTELAGLLSDEGQRDPGQPAARADFVSSAAAKDFRREAAREFPGDDVRLWVSVASS